MKKALKFFCTAVSAAVLTATSFSGGMPIEAATVLQDDARYLFQPGGSLSLNLGDMINLRFIVQEDKANYFLTKEYEWTSSNPDVVAVELFLNGQNSIIRTKAVAEGTAEITGRKEGSSDVTMTVTVTDTTPHLTVHARGTSVKYASKGRTLIGVEGTYERVSKEKILKRINEIRYEACKKGYPSPSEPEKKLTLDDYVPIKWSSDLEWIAQIRAAEATVRQEHDRPNGRGCFSVTHNGVMSTGENLAWNYSGIMDGIEQWYGEKGDWVKQAAGKVTGHYTSMINPANTHVGIGGFVKKSGGWYGIAGEFVSKEDAMYSIYKDVRETVYNDNYSERDVEYYDDSMLNDGKHTDELLYIPSIPDNPDGLDSLEDLYRLYGVQSLEEYAKLADAGKLELTLPEEQSSLKGHTIQMIEVISTRLGKEKLDAPKSIKKGKKKQLFVTQTVYDDATGVVLDTKWKSSKSSVISIDEDGTMTAKKPGKATITAEFGNKTLKKTIKVTK